MAVRLKHIARDLGVSTAAKAKDKPAVKKPTIVKSTTTKGATTKKAA